MHALIQKHTGTHNLGTAIARASLSRPRPGFDMLVVWARARYGVAISPMDWQQAARAQELWRRSIYQAVAHWHYIIHRVGSRGALGCYLGTKSSLGDEHLSSAKISHTLNFVSVQLRLSLTVCVNQICKRQEALWAAHNGRERATHGAGGLSGS